MGLRMFFALTIVCVLLKINAAIPVTADDKSNTGELRSSVSRVVNGVPVTDKDEFPFVVDLSAHNVAISSSRFCTGTLVKPNIVLTAAHCVLNDGYSTPVFATVGRIELSDHHVDNKRAETFRTVASIVHEGYKGLGSPNDVALLLLNGTSADPTVKLSAQTPNSEIEAWVVGYGIQKIGTLEDVGQRVEIMSGRLQKTALRIKENSFCDLPNGGFRTSEGMLCTAGVKEGSSACKGDSGGGLFLRDGKETVQVGVVSYGDSRCMSEESGVFTDVASVRDWIYRSGTRLEQAFHKTELYLDDATKHIVESGITALSSDSAELRTQSIVHKENVKLFHVRTNFKNKKKLTISLCQGPSASEANLSVLDMNGVVFQDKGSCPDGKKSALSLTSKRDSYVVAVSSTGSVQFRIALTTDMI